MKTEAQTRAQRKYYAKNKKVINAKANECRRLKKIKIQQDEKEALEDQVKWIKARTNELKQENLLDQSRRLAQLTLIKINAKRKLRMYTQRILFRTAFLIIAIYFVFTTMLAEFNSASFWLSWISYVCSIICIMTVNKVLR